MGAIKKSRAVFVAGKMRRHPIEDDADAALMQVIDQVHEVLRRAEVSRRRKKPGNLIAPRAKKRMIHHRHEFHVGVIQLLQIIGQLGRQFAVG